MGQVSELTYEIFIIVITKFKGDFLDTLGGIKEQVLCFTDNLLLYDVGTGKPCDCFKGSIPAYYATPIAGKGVDLSMSGAYILAG